MVHLVVNGCPLDVIDRDGGVRSPERSVVGGKGGPGAGHSPVTPDFLSYQGLLVVQHDDLVPANNLRGLKYRAVESRMLFEELMMFRKGLGFYLGQSFVCLVAGLVTRALV
jgi:hypothetical protein